MWNLECGHEFRIPNSKFHIAMIINQWVPAAHKGDAIGDSARRVRALLRAMGHDSELFALTIDDELRHDVRRFDDPAAKRGDVTIFHYALPSPMTDAFDAVPRYYSMIRALMAEYRFLNDRFVFTGAIPDEELAVYYRHAAVYVSLSEHEGFCVPLVEAMAADVPILAYGAAAVPDTLGGAGIQFAPKDLEQAAELLAALAFDDRLRADVIDGQRQRLHA